VLLRASATALRAALIVGALLWLSGLSYCAEVAAFPLTALVSERDLAHLIRPHREVWLPPTAEEIAARQADPEDAVLREAFAAWLRALVAPEWLPADGADSAVYLKVGSGRESMAFSCFYMAYTRGAAACMVKGYVARSYVTIVPSVPPSDASTEGFFEEARALQALIPAGRLGIPQHYRRPMPELRGNLRRVAERYVNPVVLPTSEEQWEDAFETLLLHNGGFRLSWRTRGHRACLPEAEREQPGHESALCSVWTNGTAVRLLIEHPFRVMNARNLVASVARQVQPETPPLNPEVVWLLDERRWYDAEGAAVSDPARAAYTVARASVQASYAPYLERPEGHREMTLEGRWGAGLQARLPLDELRWHIIEFVSLADVTGSCLKRGGYHYSDSLAVELGPAADRAALLAAARERRDGCAQAAAGFAQLRYPPEVKAERDELAAALEAEVQAWDAALAFWDSLLESYPDASAAFYRLQGENLENQLEAAGLTKVAERVGKAVQACGVPLFERYGLQDAMMAAISR